MIKTLNKLEKEGNFSNLLKNIYKINTIGNIIPNGKRLNGFFLKLGIRQKCLLSSLLFIIFLEDLTNIIREEKKIKGVQIIKEELKFSLFADDLIVYIESPMKFFS